MEPVNDRSQSASRPRLLTAACLLGWSAIALAMVAGGYELAALPMAQLVG
jgi:hypothetical protein